VLVLSIAADRAVPGSTRRFVWRRLGEHDLDHERIWSGVFLIGVVLALAVPESLRLKLVCPLKAVFGLPCLSCGSNRALSALLHLEPLRALAWNPLFVFLGLAWAVYVLYAAIVVIGRLPRMRLTGDLRPTRPVVIAVALVAVVANWLYLLAAGV
jgi:hypothetical protein